jgi:hypothetical protein
MEDPPGSPAIKTEPQDIPDGVPPVSTGEIILISDDEDETAAPVNIRTLGSPFQEESHDSGAVNLGPSMLSTTKPKPAKPSAKEAFAGVRAKIAAKQRENTEKHRMAAQPAQRTQRTPLVGRSDLFVTESNPGTPDAAEIFRVLQRDFEEKRQDGTLTWQEEIEFERAQATEKARVLKERLDQAYDGSDASVADGEDPRMSPSVASLPDEDDEEPKKRGRKRKADSATSKPQPKKRRAAAPKSAEDILVTARRKLEAKAKAKAAGKGKKEAYNKGRKKRPADPNLLNATSMRGNDIFQDAAHNRDLPDQPTFELTTRKDKDRQEISGRGNPPIHWSWSCEACRRW